MGWLRLVGSLKVQVSFAKEPHTRDDILQKRPIILRRLLIVATPYETWIYHILPTNTRTSTWHRSFVWHMHCKTHPRMCNMNLSYLPTNTLDESSPKNMRGAAWWETWLFHICDINLSHIAHKHFGWAIYMAHPKFSWAICERIYTRGCIVTDMTLSHTSHASHLSPTNTYHMNHISPTNTLSTRNIRETALWKTW